MHTSAELTLPAPQAVLFDRDGTIVVDVPYNGDPDLVQPMPGAREVLDDLRSRGIRLGVVTNQSGIARGYVTRHQVDAVNARVEELLGPFDVWEVCPHGTSDGCACRKPGPGMCSRPVHAWIWTPPPSRSSGTSGPTWVPLPQQVPGR